MSGTRLKFLPELDDLSNGVPDGAVVVDHDRLHSLDQTTLDVTSLGSLDGGINQTWKDKS